MTINEIKNHLVVFTRTLSEDYMWHVNNPNLPHNILLEITDMIDELRKKRNTTWNCVNTSSGIFVLRCVTDGRKDENGRFIDRVEGAFFKNSDHIPKYSDLEAALLEQQKKSNNYGYGNFKTVNETSSPKVEMKQEVPVTTVPRIGALISSDATVSKIDTISKRDDNQIVGSNIGVEDIKKNAFVLEIPLPSKFVASAPIEYWDTIYSGSLLPEASLKLDGVTNLFSARGRQEAFFVKKGIDSIIVELIPKPGITDFVINGPGGKQFAVRGIRDGRCNNHGRPSIIIEGLHLADQISVDENRRIQPLQLEVIDEAFGQIREETNGYSNKNGSDFSRK